jgi:hypothetical protein
MEEHPGPCVSIYLPTHRAVEMQQDQIRFKNLLRAAEEKLAALRLRTPEVQRLLEPARKLLEDPFFWQHLSDGLAVFISPRLFREFRVPLNFPELSIVTERFHVKPLLTLLSLDGQYFLLALSQNEVRLLRGTSFNATEVELESVPHGLADVIKPEEREKQLQFHTRAPAAGPGRRAAVFHGHGAAAENQKDQILRYFRRINQGIHEVLRNERAPLVLAGVEYLFPLYREANTYPYLLEQGIAGNPDGLTAEHLHARAWPIVRPHFERASWEAARRFEKLLRAGRGSDRLEEVVPAAHAGKVESLLVAVGVQRWGHYDPKDGAVVTSPEPRPSDQDLLDYAALHTLLHGGDVYAVAPERLPGASPVAACFRY